MAKHRTAQPVLEIRLIEPRKRVSLRTTIVRNMIFIRVWCVCVFDGNNRNDERLFTFFYFMMNRKVVRTAAGGGTRTGNNRLGIACTHTQKKIQKISLIIMCAESAARRFSVCVFFM